MLREIHYSSSLLQNYLLQKINQILEKDNHDSNELQDLIKAVNFMSTQFDDFKVRDLINSVKEIKEENQYLKEQNQNLKTEVLTVKKRLNIVEQEQISKHIEIICIP